MRTLVAAAVVALLAGCGVETASTAATAASLKQQEVQEGQKTMQDAQQRIAGAVQDMHEDAARAEDK